MAAIANRYAEAVFDLAIEENQIAAYEKDMKFVLSVFSDTTILSFFTHILVEDTDKLKMIDSYFKEEVSLYICNFLKILITKHRMQYIKEICKAFHELYNDYSGIEEGVLYTRFALTNEDVTNVQDIIGKKLGKKILLQVMIDSELIGGIKVQLHNQVWDGSLKNQLRILKKELLRK
jgi:F-type H+-transporting ATPase subunit delta